MTPQDPLNNELHGPIDAILIKDVVETQNVFSLEDKMRRKKSFHITLCLVMGLVLITCICVYKTQKHSSITSFTNTTKK